MGPPHPTQVHCRYKGIAPGSGGDESARWARLVGGDHVDAGDAQAGARKEGAHGATAGATNARAGGGQREKGTGGQREKGTGAF